MIRRDWLQVVQTFTEHSQFNLDLAISLTTSLAAKILPGKRLVLYIYKNLSEGFMKQLLTSFLANTAESAFHF